MKKATIKLRRGAYHYGLTGSFQVIAGQLALMDGVDRLMLPRRRGHFFWIPPRGVLHAHADTHLSPVDTTPELLADLLMEVHGLRCLHAYGDSEGLIRAVVDMMTVDGQLEINNLFLAEVTGMARESVAKHLNQRPSKHLFRSRAHA